jgi:putative copper export protein
VIASGQLFKILNFWIHLMSAFIWIGGVIFSSLVLLPAAQKHLNKDARGEFLRRIHARFQKVSGVFVTLLLITGGINIHFAKQVRGTLSVMYFNALMLKIFFFAILLTFYLLHLKELGNRKPLEHFPFQEATLVLGVLIVLMAAVLKHS